MKAPNARRTSRRSLFALALLLSSLALFRGLAPGAVRSSAKGQEGGGAQSRSTDSKMTQAEGIEKDFNDDDLKVKEQKPRGRSGAALRNDESQFNDPSVPVVVGGVQSISGAGKYAGVVKIKRVSIKNRSAKTVNSVQLRWVISSFDEREKVLSEGTVPFANIWLGADSSEVIEIPTVYPALLLKRLARDGELNGRFWITIGVEEARFADGSFWRRPEPTTLLKSPYLDPPLGDDFPLLASILSAIPPLESHSSRTGVTPCNAEPRKSASAFSFVPLQIESCHDNMAT